MRCTSWILLTGVLLLQLSGQGLTQVPAAAAELTVRVDPRVELMSIIFRLAGNPEYNQPSSASPYADDVEEHFGTLREHPVVQLAQRLRSSRGVSYDAVMSMAVHVEDTASLQEKVPFDRSPPRLDGRWRVDEARDFLKKARDFVTRSRFDEFFAQHTRLYQKGAERLQEVLRGHEVLSWFEGFFGARQAAEFQVILGMLTGGGCYGVSVEQLDGREEITPVIGAWRFDDDGVPLISDGVVSTVVHEFAHPYANPLMDAQADALEDPARALYARREAVMKRQAYGTWSTMMRESLVRACVVRYVHDTQGAAAAEKHARYETSRGFAWAGELAQLLGEYEKHRERHPDLDSFMPRVVKFFHEWEAREAASRANAPRLVSTDPPDGARDVDPGLEAITIVFDRPMRDGSWSMVILDATFPEIAGDLSFDAERQVLTVPVTLQAGTSYSYGLNSASHQGFQSEDGIPLAPLEIRFETR